MGPSRPGKGGEPVALAQSEGSCERPQLCSWEVHPPAGVGPEGPQGEHSPGEHPRQGRGESWSVLVTAGPPGRPREDASWKRPGQEDTLRAAAEWHREEPQESQVRLEAPTPVTPAVPTAAKPGGLGDPGHQTNNEMQTFLRMCFLAPRTQMLNYSNKAVTNPAMVPGCCRRIKPLSQRGCPHPASPPACFVFNSP